MKNISILGATGSIGLQTLDIINRDSENFVLKAISVNKNYQETINIINKFNPKYVAVADEENKAKIQEFCKNHGLRTKILGGMSGLITIATLEEVDTVVTSVVGMIGLVPTIRAIEAGKNIALANKETLVVAGEIVTSLARENNISITPVDSEHCAIFQCLQGNEHKNVEKLILTASGGPFRGKPKEELKNVTVADALKHPNWSMGKKITIDSATLMNKGLEVIEAHWLFDIGYENINVVVHPESIIHSMVEYCDGSVIAQLGNADMRLPIQYALSYPDRGKRIVEKINFSTLRALTFSEPDTETFKCLKLAYYAGNHGKLMPTILNGANEACVELFLNNRIKFNEISEIIEECMIKFDYSQEVTVDNIINMDKMVKDYVSNKYDK